MAGIGVWLRPKIFRRPRSVTMISASDAATIGARAMSQKPLRDFGLLLGTLALWRLAHAHST